jgi:hypothetical protein
MKFESSIVDPTVKEGAQGAHSESAAINETWISGKPKPLYARVPQILGPGLLVISMAAYAQESSDKPIISLSTVSKLDHSQPGIYRTKIGKIDVIAVSDGTVGLGLTKELIQNAKPGEVEHLLARHFEKSPLAGNSGHGSPWKDPGRSGTRTDWIRTLDNVLVTPHLGYVSHGLYKTFYEDTVSNIRKWLDTH